MSDAVRTLRALAQSLENPADRAEALDVVDTLDRAQSDGDKAIHIDEHFSAEVAVRELMYRFDAQSTEHAFVKQLRETMWFGYQEDNDRFTPYRLIHRDGAFAAEAAGEEFRVDRDEVATHITVSQFEQLLGERYEVLYGRQNGIDVDEGSRVFGAMRVRDRVTGDEIEAHRLLPSVSAELLLQSRLTVGEMEGRSESRLDFVSMIHGQEQVGVRDWERIRLPEFLSTRPINARGTRLSFILARELARQGRVSEDDVRAWIAEDDSDAATEEVLKHIEYLSLGAYNGYDTTFARGFDVDDHGMAYDRMRYALEHGVVIFSHDEDMDQVLPDYRYDDAVRTPTGPAMLVFDAPIAELSTEEIYEAWPGKRDYLFGLDSIEFVLDQHAPSPAYPQSPDAAHTPIDSADLTVDVASMYDRMYDLVGILRREPREDDFRAADERLSTSYELMELVDRVEPIITEAEAELRTVQAEQSRIAYRDDDRRGLRVDRDEVRRIESRAETLSAFVEEARAVRGFGRRAMAVYFNQGENRPDPANLLEDVEQAALRASATEPSTVAAVVRAQQELIGTRQSARLERAFSSQDHEQLDAYVPWYRDWLIPDYVLHGLIFGTSVDGRLVRESGDALDVDDAHLDAFTASYERGEVVTNQSLDALLANESPQYRSDRAELNSVRPVFLTLESVGRAAGAASGALRSAEHAILMRNITPMTVTRSYTTTDSNGNTRTEYRTEPNPTYYMWAAIAAAASARAEAEVEELNRHLQSLREHLEAEGFQSRFGGVVDEQINWFLGSLWGNWFFGSFDSWDVNRMQRQLDEVLTNLQPVVGEVGPVYARYHAAVSQGLSARRRELLDR